jgi:hypothetical protein
MSVGLCALAPRSHAERPTEEALFHRSPEQEWARRWRTLGITRKRRQRNGLWVA